MDRQKINIYTTICAYGKAKLQIVNPSDDDGNHSKSYSFQIAHTKYPNIRNNSRLYVYETNDRRNVYIKRHENLNLI